MIGDYSEDRLIEQTAIDIFFNQLGWDTILAFNNENFGDDSTLGRSHKKEVVLKKILLAKLKQFNPDLPDVAYTLACDKLTEASSTKSLAEINYEKHLLLKKGIEVDFIDDKGTLNRVKSHAP